MLDEDGEIDSEYYEEEDFVDKYGVKRFTTKKADDEYYDEEQD